VNRIKKIMLGGLFFGSTALLCFGGYRVYDRHYLSSDLKRTLVAAVDPSASENDLVAYIRDARLQVRTTRDREVFTSFQDSYRLLKDVSEMRSRRLSDAMHSLRSMAAGDSMVEKLIEIRSEYWRSNIPVPKSLLEEIAKALNDEKAKETRDAELRDLEEKRADAEEKKGRALYAEVRTALGLPPLPSGTDGK